MSTIAREQSDGSRIGVAEFLGSLPCPNTAARRQVHRNGAVIIEIPMNRPAWLVPPISWLVPFSSHRRVRLDEIGLEVFDMCDGAKTVETIIELFAVKNKLSFREAQLPVTQFLQQMTERGIIAIVGESGESQQA